MLKKWILAILITTILTACAQVPPTQTPTPEQKNVTNLPLQQTAKEYPPPQAAEESYPSPNEQALQPPYPDPQVELMQAGTRYGIPEVDRVLDTLFLHPDQADSLLVYTKAACTMSDGLGGPPKCTESQNEGTIVEGIPVLGSEGQFIPQGSRSLTDIIGQTDLLGVFKVVEDLNPKNIILPGSTVSCWPNKQPARSLSCVLPQMGLSAWIFRPRFLGKSSLTWKSISNQAAKPQLFSFPRSRRPPASPRDKPRHTASLCLWRFPQPTAGPNHWGPIHPSGSCALSRPKF